MLLYSAIRRLQGLKDKWYCYGFNMLLASQNREVRATRGRQFAKRKNDHSPEISEKSKKRTFSPEFNLENGRVVATETSDLYPCRIFDQYLDNESITTYFPVNGESRFSIPKIKRSDFLCVSPTFASPIEKPATSTHRRIWREIIGNTEGNAKTVDSLRHCKWANSTSRSAPKTKKPTGGPVGGESKKWSG